MAANKVFNFGPLALTNTLTTNLFNPNASSGGVNSGSSGLYAVIKHMRVVNKTSSPVTVSLWKGATGANAAGSEVAWQGTPVPGNSYLDWYGQMRFDTTDFLVGGAGANTALSLQGEGEIGVAG